MRKSLTEHIFNILWDMIQLSTRLVMTVVKINKVDAVLISNLITDPIQIGAYVDSYR
jgi:hypothetical protein